MCLWCGSRRRQWAGRLCVNRFRKYRWQKWRRGRIGWSMNQKRKIYFHEKQHHSQRRTSECQDHKLCRPFDQIGILQKCIDELLVKIWPKVASQWHNKDIQKLVDVCMWEICYIRVHMAICGSKLEQGANLRDKWQ